MSYIYCEASILHFYIDYLHSINQYYSLIFVTNINDIKDYILKNIYDKIIFIREIPDELHIHITDFTNIYVLNTEQLSTIKYVDKFLDNNIKIIDYSSANIEYIDTKYKELGLVSYLPYMINKNEIYDYPKISDVAVIGWWNSEHRMNITNKLIERGVNVSFISGFGHTRDEQLFAHKILLNIHYNETYKVFEQMRCNRCIFNKMIVISETSVDKKFELDKYMIESPYEELVEKVIYSLANYNEIYDELFCNFNLDDIHEKYYNTQTIFVGLTL